MFKQKNALDKNILWYLYLLANVLVIIGCAITWILAKQKEVKLNILYVSTLVCNVLAIGITFMFCYFEFKNIFLQSMHFNKKWLKIYYASLFVFLLMIVWSFVFYLFIQKQLVPVSKMLNIYLIIYIVVVMVLSLICIALQRYARFKIDLDIYKKNHGSNEEIKKVEDSEVSDSAIKDNK